AISLKATRQYGQAGNHKYVFAIHLKEVTIALKALGLRNAPNKTLAQITMCNILVTLKRLKLANCVTMLTPNPQFTLNNIWRQLPVLKVADVAPMYLIKNGTNLIRP